MVSASIDYYHELGIERYATPAEIRDAYKRAALRWHPDRNKAKEAEEKFKTIKRAYDVLIDDKRRRQYDAERFPTPPSSTWFETKTYEHSFNIHSFEDLMAAPIDPLDILSDLQFFQESNFTSKMLNSPAYRQLYTQLFQSMNPPEQADRSSRKGRRASKRASVPVFPSYTMSDWSFVELVDFDKCRLISSGY